MRISEGRGHLWTMQSESILDKILFCQFSIPFSALSALVEAKSWVVAKKMRSSFLNSSLGDRWGSRVPMHPHGLFIYNPLTPLERGHFVGSNPPNSIKAIRSSKWNSLSLWGDRWGSRVPMHPHGLFVYNPLTPLKGGTSWVRTHQ